MDSIRNHRQDAGHWGVLIEVPDPGAAAEWLMANLFFTPVAARGEDTTGRMLVNGSCVLYLKQGASTVLPMPAAGHYYTGLAHVALRTDRIDEAIRWCESRRLTLQLDAGASFYNPKVFGSGERFFNIISPFGVIFEVSQRIGHPSPFQETVICGLDHLGIPSPDIGSELAFFEARGFRPAFATVENWNEAEGTIHCCMLSQADPLGHELTLEVYQFLDLKPEAMPSAYGIRGLAWSGETASSPAGVSLMALEAQL